MKLQLKEAFKQALMQSEIEQSRQKFISRIEGGMEGWPLVIPENRTYEAYRNLGSRFRSPIRKRLALISDFDKWPGRLTRAQNAFEGLYSLAEGENEFSGLINEYLVAINGWAEGAGISRQQAMALQDDNTGGCQTAAVRLPDNSVLISHTEEEVFSDLARVSVAPAVEMNLDGKKQLSVVYNDLLPGSSTFSAGEKSTVACDYLWLREDFEGKSLINSLTWMVWRMGEDADRDRVGRLIKTMQPFVDGLAVIVARETPEGIIDSYKITCAGDQFATEVLGPEPGNNLYQITIVDPAYSEKHPDLYRLALQPSKHDNFDKYQARLNIFKELFGHSSFRNRLSRLDIENNEKIHRLAHNFMSYTERIPGGWDVANESVVMSCSGLLRPGKNNSLKLNLGAAQRHETSFEKDWNP